VNAGAFFFSLSKRKEKPSGKRKEKRRIAYTIRLPLAYASGHSHNS
jgi:hypothetical protein